MSDDALIRNYEQLQREATALAGGLKDLSQRAAVYRHLYLASNGNHAFPLIAAHGALWAGGYFRFGTKLGNALSWQYVFRNELRQKQLVALADFADVFRDVNRCVCIDSYVNFHFTRRWGNHPDASNYVDVDLLDALNRLHRASHASMQMSESEKLQVFKAHFLHEQKHVVGPRITAAISQFPWPLLRMIAVRPVVRFAYFPNQTRLWFRNFGNQEERIANGLKAFVIASQVGWKTVDNALQNYRVLPTEFFQSPEPYFNDLRTHLLAAI